MCLEMKKMKGQLYILESTIAILLMLFIVILLFQKQPTSSEFKRINYKIRAYEALKTLDEVGLLRKYAVDSNKTSIESEINSSIPDFLSYQVVIFNETTNTTEKISTTSETASVSYFIAGDFNNYDPRDVRVYLWEFE